MEKDPQKIEKEVNSYMRYSGIGFQIAGAAALGFFIGYKLDKYFTTSGPYFTIAFAIVFLFAGMYLAFRDLLKNK